MRWGYFAIALVGVMLAQTALAPDWVDLFAALAFVIALTAAAPEACLAAWMTGFVQDLASTGRLGIHAVLLGVAAWVLVRVRELVNREIGWVRWLVICVVALPLQYFFVLYQRVWEAAHFTWRSAVVYPLGVAACSALVAALALAVPTFYARRRHQALRW